MSTWPVDSRKIRGACLLTALLVLGAGEASAQTMSEVPDRARIADAVARGLPLVEQAAGRYPEHRKCFSCHHQTLPMLAIVSARHAGLKTNEAVLREQADFTRVSFERELKDLRAGEGIGGKGLTVGYGLWTLGLDGRKPDEVSEAMVRYLLKIQEFDGHWSLHSVRPPMEESLATSTLLAVIGFKKYATAEQKVEADAAAARAKLWFEAYVPSSQEDRVSRLWGLKLLEGAPELQAVARRAVLSAQRDDGGWSQLDNMDSDAYATGQTLAVLYMTGLKPNDEAARRAVEFLLRSQTADGSWFVKSRAKPVQVYFDNGDPYGKDQFISTTGSCWALVALSMSARTEP